MNEAFLKKEILDFLNRNNPDFTTRDVISFMALVRTIMEYWGNKKHWEVINFYCNWVLHPELSQSNYGHTPWVFNLLAETLNNDYGNSEKITAGITTAVGLEKLRNDIQLFLRSIFTTEELSEENSRLNNNFMGTIAYIILGRPVFNKKNSSGIYTSGTLNIVHPISGAIVYISKIILTDLHWKAMLSIYLDPSPPYHTDNSAPFMIIQINQLK